MHCECVNVTVGATESKKCKAKDWEADDYYDSDDDTLLDRTGTVEKKRQHRMRAAAREIQERLWRRTVLW